MGYDHWKTTNPADEFLGPDPQVERDEERALAAIEAHREWDARRKVLLEVVLWLQGRGLHGIASEMWDDLIGPEPTDG